MSQKKGGIWEKNSFKKTIKTIANMCPAHIWVEIKNFSFFFFFVFAENEMSTRVLVCWKECKYFLFETNQYGWSLTKK